MNTDPNQQSDQNIEYIKLTFQTALDDIRFFKRQQWIVTNYTLLIFGAIIAASRFITYCGCEWLVYLIGIITLLAILLVFQLQCSTQKARHRRDGVRKELPKKYENLLFGENQAGRCSEFLDQYSVMCLLIMVIIGGSVLSVCILSS